MLVNWIKCTGDFWCPLQNVDLTGVTVQGVYIIWHAGTPGRVVRIGQGDVAARLAAHHLDPVITQYAKFGTLYVTWAAVPTTHRDGVERYLANL